MLIEQNGEWTACRQSNLSLRVWGLEIQDQGTGGLGVLWGPTSSFTSTTFLLEHHMVEGQPSIFVLIL